MALAARPIRAAQALLCATFLAAVLLPVAAHAAAEGPSFDCKAARSKTEKAICASPAASAMDRRVAAAYRAAMATLDVAGRKALQDDQQFFLQARDMQFAEEKTYKLADDLEWRAQILEAIEPPGAGFAGTWANVNGNMTVKPAADGRFAVEINTVQPYPSYPTCMLEATGVVTGDRLVVGGEAADRETTEGWTVVLQRRGDSLWAELHKPADAEYVGPPFCGFRSSINGSFLSVKKLPGDAAR
ncbi:lysozyme inhibitor LprI family protein [Xanthobacteraceae bacterium A53D]